MNTTKLLLVALMAVAGQNREPNLSALMKSNYINNGTLKTNA
jgi:hypothetical protein